MARRRGGVVLRSLERSHVQLSGRSVVAKTLKENSLLFLGLMSNAVLIFKAKKG